jgi:hypothetical protein
MKMAIRVMAEKIKEELDGDVRQDRINLTDKKRKEVIPQAKVKIKHPFLPSTVISNQ